MDQYAIRVTAQARQHLRLIRDYIAVDLREPEIAKFFTRSPIGDFKLQLPGIESQKSV